MRAASLLPTCASLSFPLLFDEIFRGKGKGQRRSGSEAGSLLYVRGKAKFELCGLNQPPEEVGLCGFEKNDRLKN